MDDRRKLPEHHEDNHDTDRTRAMDAASTRGMPPARTPPPPQPTPPPPPAGRAAPPEPRQRPLERAVPQSNTPAALPARRGRARTRRDSGFYLPLWSLALMLFVVLIITGGIVALIIGLGGRSAPELDPVIIVSTSVPTEVAGAPGAVPASPTIPPEFDPSVSGVRPSALQLSGPTLVPVSLSPTPQPITLGGQVRVIDVGIQQLNVRDRAGTRESTVVFRAEEGTIFTVVGGPEQADGLTWWRVQEPENEARAGWAAANYLQLLTED